MGSVLIVILWQQYIFDIGTVNKPHSYHSPNSFFVLSALCCPPANPEAFSSGDIHAGWHIAGSLMLPLQ